MDELWDIARVAAYLGVTERTVYNKVRAGDLPAVKVGRLWRVRESELWAWLEGGARTAPPASLAAASRESVRANLVAEPGGAGLAAEPGAIPTRGELATLLAPVADVLERRLAFVALLSAGVEALGWPAPVVVGGHAVEFYTAGGYATVDIDLAGASEPVGQVLDAWGFEREGRHWFDEALGLVVEVPGASLPPDQAAHTVSVRIGRVTARVLGIEDLIVDRLAACKHWRHTESCEWAARLLALADLLDDDYLTHRAAEEDLADALAVAREGASGQ
jgi:excisionase family DNA binding protein